MKVLKVSEWTGDRPDEGLVSVRVILRERANGWFATHIQRQDNEATMWGNYLEGLEKALVDFRGRCEKYGVEEAKCENSQT